MSYVVGTLSDQRVGSKQQGKAHIVRRIGALPEPPNSSDDAGLLDPGRLPSLFRRCMIRHERSCLIRPMSCPISCPTCYRPLTLFEMDGHIVQAQKQAVRSIACLFRD